MSWWGSVTRVEQYLRVCAEAAIDKKAFRKFKQHPVLKIVFEHTTARDGREHLKQILEHNPQFLGPDHIKKFHESDRMGGGQPIMYGGYNISPPTLKYIAVVNAMVEFFGSLDDMNIIEIGGGYGGQMKTIYDLYTPASYTIVDLKECLDLTEKYVGEFGLKFIPIPGHRVAPIGTNLDLTSLPKDAKFDLCLSSYSITEFDSYTQALYKERICDQSTRGFIQCNAKFNYGIRSADIAARSGNFIVTWNDS